jgi:hypothetical protein
MKTFYGSMKVERGQRNTTRRQRTTFRFKEEVFRSSSVACRGRTRAPHFPKDFAEVPPIVLDPSSTTNHRR